VGYVHMPKYVCTCVHWDLYEANRWLTQALELNHHTFQVGSVHMPKYVCTCVHCVDAKRVCMCVHCEDTKCVCMCVHCVDKSRVCMCVYVYVCDKMFREFRWSQINWCCKRQRGGK
jgi:hypothetical protein